jgi:hypothetical protein
MSEQLLNFNSKKSTCVGVCDMLHQAILLLNIVYDSYLFVVNLTSVLKTEFAPDRLYSKLV